LIGVGTLGWGGYRRDGWGSVVVGVADLSVSREICSIAAHRWIQSATKRSHGHNLAVAPSPRGGTWGVRTRRRLVGWSAERLAFCCSAVCAGAMLRAADLALRRVASLRRRLSVAGRIGYRCPPRRRPRRWRRTCWPLRPSPLRPRIVEHQQWRETGARISTSCRFARTVSPAFGCAGLAALACPARLWCIYICCRVLRLSAHTLRLALTYATAGYYTLEWDQHRAASFLAEIWTCWRADPAQHAIVSTRRPKTLVSHVAALCDATDLHILRLPSCWTSHAERGTLRSGEKRPAAAR